MFSFLICLLGIAIGIVSWFKNKKYITVLMLFFFLTNYYQLEFLSQASLFAKPLDYALLMSTPIMLHGLIHHPSYFTIKGDPIAKCVLLLELYFFLSFIYTVISGIQDINWALKVYRTQFFFLFYFWLRRVPVSNYVIVFKAVLGISMILLIFFYLQLVDIKLISGGTDEPLSLSQGTFSRMRNLPFMTIIFFIILAFSKIKKLYKYLLFILWGGALVLSQHRGMILSIAIAIPFGLLMKARVAQALSFIRTLTVIALLFSPILIYRFTDKGGSESSITEEINKGLSMRDTKKAEIEGTFTFRIFLVLERIEYMIAHPNKLLFGIGSVHEDSPYVQRKYNFTIGADKADKSGNFTIKQQIDTTDVAFISFFMRYGLIGLSLIILLLVILFKQFSNKTNRRIEAQLGFTLMLYCFMRITSGDEFSHQKYLIFFICYIVIIKINKYEHQKRICHSRNRNIQSASVSPESN